MDTSNPLKVSVVIPVYNEEHYIIRCLESLVAQEEKADEIIVVDNNCTDGTVAIAQRYGVTIVHEQTQGMIPARNAGFNAAHYEIIARCDADCELPSDWIKKMKTDFVNKKIDALTGPIAFYDLITTTNTTVLAQIYLTIIKLLLRGNEPLLGPNMMITQEAWMRIKNEVCLNDKKVHEDVDLSIHLIKHNFKIMHDKSLIVRTSARRLKKRPGSFFLEYPLRMGKTFAAHI